MPKTSSLGKECLPSEKMLDMGSTTPTSFLGGEYEMATENWPLPNPWRTGSEKSKAQANSQLPGTQGD